ncbi:MAG: hypothetical protein KDK72_10415 [Chlamydiia bacterium]|nr:hypothetical protein [Chlamydiia bacterium]
MHEGITTGHLQEKIDSTINRMLADQYDAASSGATDVEPNICSLIQKTVRNPPFLFYDIHDRFLTMRNSFIDALHKKRTTKLVALYNKINDLIKIVDPARRYENEYLKDFFERKELLQAIDELDNDQKALIMRHINPDTNEARKVITYVTSMLSRTGLSLVNAKITGIFANWKRGAAFCRELPNCCFIWKPDARQYHLLQEYSDPNHQITRTLVSDKTFLPRSLMINGKQFEIVEADWKGDERKMVLGKLLCRLNANGFGWEASESTAKKVAKSYLNNPDSTRLDPKFNLLRLMTFPGQAIADDRFRCAFPCLDDGDVVAKPLDGSKYTIDIDSKSQLEEGSYSISWSRDFELRKKIGQDVIGRPNIDMTSKKLGTFVLKSILDARYVGGSVTFSGRFFIDHLNIDERNEPMLIHAIRSAITDYDVDSVTEMPREKG